MSEQTSDAMDGLLQVRVPKDLLTRIDGARGDASRSTWVRRAIEGRLGNDAVKPLGTDRMPIVRQTKTEKRRVVGGADATPTSMAEAAPSLPIEKQIHMCPLERCHKRKLGPGKCSAHGSTLVATGKGL